MRVIREQNKKNSYRAGLENDQILENCGRILELLIGALASGRNRLLLPWKLQSLSDIDTVTKPPKRIQTLILRKLVRGFPPRREMQEKKSETANKNPKKANLVDHHSIKHLLDESVSEIVASRGYKEDVRMSNTRLLIGTVVIIIALFAQFYKKKFPENRDFLIGCIVLYVVFNVLLQLIGSTKEKNAILFTYPPPESFSSTGLVVSSKLTRFSDLYTLTISSADPKSISAIKPVHFTKSVTQWFTKEGIMVEGLFWRDVEALIDDYAREPKKTK